MNRTSRERIPFVDLPEDWYYDCPAVSILEKLPDWLPMKDIINGVWTCGDIRLEELRDVLAFDKYPICKSNFFN